MSTKTVFILLMIVVSFYFLFNIYVKIKTLWLLNKIDKDKNIFDEWVKANNEEKHKEKQGKESKSNVD